MDCSICNSNFDSLIGFSIHLKTHNMSIVDYGVKYLGVSIPKCPICGKSCKHRKSLVFNKTCGDPDCILLLSKSRKHSIETKEKIRKSRFEYISLRTGVTV